MLIVKFWVNFAWEKYHYHIFITEYSYLPIFFGRRILWSPLADFFTNIFRIYSLRPPCSRACMALKNSIKKGVFCIKLKLKISHTNTMIRSPYNFYRYNSPEDTLGHPTFSGVCKNFWHEFFLRWFLFNPWSHGVEKEDIETWSTLSLTVFWHTVSACM